VGGGKESGRKGRGRKRIKRERDKNREKERAGEYWKKYE